MITLYFHLQSQFKYDQSFHIYQYFTPFHGLNPVEASSFQLLKLENLLHDDHFHLQPQFMNYMKYMNYFIYTSHPYTAWEHMNSIKLTLLPMCGFKAQLVEHCTGIAEVMGSNPVEALICFRCLLSSRLIL